MPNTRTLPVKGNVLTWARETAGLSIDEAATKLHVDSQRLLEHERGLPINKTLFDRMASVYRRAPSVLLFPTPPKQEALPRDFRTLGGETPELSEKVRGAFREARQIQEDITGLVQDEPSLLEYSAPDEAVLSDSPTLGGGRVRTTIGVTVSQQRRWPRRDAFKYWRARVQASYGLLVLLEKMPMRGCRGFSIWEENLIPTIVVNKDDGDEGKIFTLFHELGHIALRQGGICLSLDGSSDVEKWCNDFAGAILVSEEAARAVALTFERDRPRQWSVREIVGFARDLRVSRDVVALRFIAMGAAYPDLYDRVIAEREPYVPPSSSGPVLPHYIRLNEIGHTAASVVLGAVHSGLIDSTEAAEIMHLKPRWFRDMETYLLSQKSELAAR